MILHFSNTIADITSSDDAIHSNNNVTINSGEYIISSDDDGIHADNSLVINGGNINILKSYEGLEGKKMLKLIQVKYQL
ncbi:MAG: carbohydrate-binding domain-containing protein [Clostridium sp.]|nr:MAG: carbohydrate-binding domain-containing protein [Clostridium sp.]